MVDIDIITYQLGEIRFGMYADQILEIVQFSGASAVPRPLPYIVGLTEHRKYLVTVVDFRKRLGLPAFDVAPGLTMIITKISSGMIGVLVDSLSHFKRVPENHILPPLSIAGFPEHLLRGVLTEGDDILMMPYIDKIFSSYIPVKLLPITPAEKIAFQYRFTPGALTKTLENTLTIQGYLDRIIVNKLPRSMGLSSVIVHKITSYYPDFLPKGNASESKSWQRRAVQEFKAGDETYLSLSQNLSEQHVQKEQEERPKIGPNKDDLKTSLYAEHHYKPERKRGPFAASVSSSRSPHAPGSDADFGKHPLDMLQETPVRFSSYLSYYSYDEHAHHKPPGKGLSGAKDKEAPSSPMLSEERLLELCGTVQRVEDLLHMLDDEQQAFTHTQMQILAQQYQVTPVKLARLRTLFPNIQYIPPEKSDQDEILHEFEEEPTPSERVQAQERQPNERLRQLRTTVRHHPELTVSQWMQLLSVRHLLSENQAIRDIATHLHIPTCRLSKFRSYYQLKIED